MGHLKMASVFKPNSFIIIIIIICTECTKSMDLSGSIALERKLGSL